MRIKNYRILFIIPCLLVAMKCTSNILYVPATYTTISSALNAAGAGDTILVSPGVYYEHIFWPATQGLKLISAGDSTDTFIDANFSGRPITFSGTMVLDTSTVIKGFTLRHGAADTNPDPGFGGGLYLKYASVRLIDLHICHNTIYAPGSIAIGGGISCIKSNPQIDNCRIDHNQLTGDFVCGGAMHMGGSDPRICNTTFNDNYLHSASWCYGGGIYIEDTSHPTFQQCEISYNLMADSASWYHGGGIYSDYLSCPVLKNTIVRANRMGDHGIWHGGGGIYISVGAYFILENVAIDSNYTGGDGGWNDGGGLLIDRCYDEPCISSVKITNVKITNNTMGDNSSRYSGAGLVIGRCDTVRAVNLLVTGNLSGVNNDDWGYDASGISVEDSCYLTLINATIADNRRRDSSNVGSGNYFSAVAQVRVQNSIFWNPDNHPEMSFVNSSFTATYSDIRLGVLGTGNLWTDPLFVGSGDYHLQENSPCIGSGTDNGAPLFDLDSTLRPLPTGTFTDMGAYEDTTFYARVLKAATDTRFEFYPNPASDKLFVVWDGDATVEMTIYNVHGAAVLEGSLSKGTNEISLSGLPAGMYIIRVKDPRSSTSLKFLKE